MTTSIRYGKTGTPSSKACSPRPRCAVCLRLSLLCQHQRSWRDAARASSSCHHLHGDAIRFGHSNDTFVFETAIEVRIWKTCLVAILQINSALRGKALSSP